MARRTVGLVPNREGTATITVEGSATGYRDATPQKFDVTVLPGGIPAEAPAVMIDGPMEIVSGNEGTFTLQLTGGTYDDISYEWAIEEAAGTLDRDDADEVVVLASNASGDHEISVTVTVRGTGFEAMDETSDEATASTFFHIP